MSIFINLMTAATLLHCEGLEKTKQLMLENYPKWENANSLQYTFLKQIFVLKNNNTLPFGDTAAVVAVGQLRDEATEALIFYISGPIACNFGSLNSNEYRYFESIK